MMHYFKHIITELVSYSWWLRSFVSSQTLAKVKRNSLVKF